MSRAKILEGTRIFTDYGFPMEIQQARAKLWSKYKQAKTNYSRAIVLSLYSAKIERRQTVTL